MAFYGYARVSTADQDLAIQAQALRAAGCDVIRAEKATGTSRTGRVELELLLEFLRPGDTLVVTRIDRLARSIKDLQDIVHVLKGEVFHSRRQNSPSIQPVPQEKPSWTCSAFLPNLKLICAKRDSLKELPPPRQGECTVAGRLR